ncbi:MAG: hypothetical protein ACJAUP_001589 [Cellvibrionaceae bacterium]|jgi:hypothetical protein
MFSFQQYISAWLFYIVCVVFLLAVFWRISKNIPWLHVKQCARLAVASLFLVPAIVEGTTIYWSPAWIKGLLTLIFSGQEGIFPMAKVLLTAVLASFIIYFFILMALYFYKQVRRAKS